MKIKKFFSTLATTIATFLLIVAAFFALSAKFNLPGGWKVYSVLTGSMAPDMPEGSLIFTRAPSSENSIREGDIISFEQPGFENKIITHRVADIEELGNGRIYSTQGDANPEPDPWTVPYGRVTGIYQWQVPYLGAVFQFIQSKLGIILLVLLPVLYLVIHEIRNIVRIIVEDKVEKRLKDKEPKPSSKHVQLGVSLALLLLYASVSLTYASFLSNTVHITNLSLTTADTFPHVVINEVYYDLCAPAPTCGNPAKNNWVELYNTTASAINLTGWSLETITGSNTHSDTLPSGTTIPAGGFLVVTPEASTFDFWPGVPTSQQVILGDNIGNGLQPNGDNLRLKDNGGNLVDAISYGLDTSVLSPSITDVAAGHSIERDPDGADTDTASDFVDRTLPQPGV